MLRAQDEFLSLQDSMTWLDSDKQMANIWV